MTICLAGMDRGGFDADYNCVNTFIQYNYSHDNLWFCGIMKRRNRNVVIRYNVSENDREGIYFYGFEREKQARDIHIYNNTHYVRRGLNVRVFAEDRTPLNTRFENNIFFFEGKGHWGRKARGIGTTFDNNLYYNISPHGTDKRGQTAHPRLVAPGRAGTGIDLETMADLAGYRPRTDSPCVDAASDVEGNGQKDVLGVAVRRGRADIGACESR